MSITRSVAVVALAAVLGSCSSLDTTGCTVVLRSSSDDQTSFQMAFNAHNGANICVAPGTYHFTDSISEASLTGMTFRGLGATPADVVLDFHTMTAGERGVSFTSMTNVSVSNMTILDAVHDNLYFHQCTGVTVRHVVSGWTPARAQPGAYAIYPVECMNVLLDQCEAYGSADAGLYVGQTTNCIVSNSLVHGNVAGLEIENSTHCEVFGNTTRDNTAGILVFELPGLLHQGMSTSVHDNISTGNNRMNFAASGIVRHVPEGLGIMIMGAHEIEVRNNMVSGNGTTGILLVDYQTAVLNGADVSSDHTYDGHLRHVYVHDNTQSNNAHMPAAAVAGLAGLTGAEVDIIWDMFVPTDNIPPQLCIASSGTFRAVDAPHGFATPPVDGVPSEAATCMTPHLAPVML